MLIVGINGSPNQDGNTVFLLQEALAVAEKAGAETKMLHVKEILDDLESPFCELCSSPCDGSCAEGNKLGEAFELLKQADGVMMGSPVYFGTVSSQLKAFWDKTRVLQEGKGSDQCCRWRDCSRRCPLWGAGNHPQGAPRYDAGTGHDDCWGWLCGL